MGQPKTTTAATTTTTIGQCCPLDNHHHHNHHHHHHHHQLPNGHSILITSSSSPSTSSSTSTTIPMHHHHIHHGNHHQHNCETNVSILNGNSINSSMMMMKETTNMANNNNSDQQQQQQQQSILNPNNHSLFHPTPIHITAALNSTPTPILSSNDTYICCAYSPRCFIIQKVMGLDTFRQFEVLNRNNVIAKNHGVDDEVEDVMSVSSEMAGLPCLSDLLGSSWTADEYCEVFADGGASGHIFNDRKYFVDLHSCKVNDIITRSGLVKASRIGTVELEIHNGFEWKTVSLSNSWFVESSPMNLISLGQLTKRGDIHFKGDYDCTVVYQSGKPVIYADRSSSHENMYLVRARMPKAKVSLLSFSKNLVERQEERQNRVEKKGHYNWMKKEKRCYRSDCDQGIVNKFESVEVPEQNGIAENSVEQVVASISGESLPDVSDDIVVPSTSCDESFVGSSSEIVNKCDDRQEVSTQIGELEQVLWFTLPRTFAGTTTTKKQVPNLNRDLIVAIVYRWFVAYNHNSDGLPGGLLPLLLGHLYQGRILVVNDCISTRGVLRIARSTIIEYYINVN